MKFILLVVSFLFLNLNVNAQLDPFYMGIYLNEAQTESYNINFIPEEGVESTNCFSFSYSKMNNSKASSVVKGIGYCAGEENFEIMLESATIKLDVNFSIDSQGAKMMTVHNSDGKIGIFTELIEIIEVDQSLADKIYTRKDGSEMLVSHNYDGPGFIFTIYGKTSDKCTLNEVSGTVTPLNTELTLFEYKVGSGRIVFKVVANIMTVTEENISNPNGASCVPWTGDYLLK